jgi:cathepsin C
MFVLFAVAMADLPVHCMKSQIVGEWQLYMTPASETRSSCGHRRPDAPKQQPALDMKEIEAKYTEKRTVTFVDKGLNKVVAKHDGKEDYFSMVYDEGMEFNLADKTFFAFSRFDLVPNLADPAKPLNVSKCDETELGWYATTDRKKFGCFYGKKTVPLPVKQALVNDTKAPKPIPDEPINQSTHEAKVAFINTRATTWKAKAYERFNGMSLAQMSQRAGHRRVREEADSEPRSFLQTGSTASALKRSLAIMEELPKSFDWRNKDGKDYTEPVMDQADCGSCYVVSTMHMLNARHRIKLGDDYDRERDLLSTAFPLFCSEYNQGCEGGFSNLVSRWSQDVGLVPARCKPYTTTGVCSLDEKCIGSDKRYRADGHRYVGGYYGKANAGDMMLELQNGPFAIGLAVNDDFMYYTEGIYKGSDLLPIEKTDGWLEMQHGVLLVGWGEEDGHKYWIVQNSWGGDWGEDGYFRITRGENDSGVESSPEAADVVEDESNGARVASFLAQLDKHTLAQLM